MVAKILPFKRPVNGVVVEQRRVDGFLNGTSMCVAHGKDISDWLKTDDTWELVCALAKDLGIEPKSHKSGNSVYIRASATFPSLIVVTKGSPQNGGGTWVHPDLGVYLAQWCSKSFAIQVSRWVQEWLLTGQNPIYSSDADREWIEWQQRYDIRIELKDTLRPELMNVVARWAEANAVSPRTLCSAVHDVMNERIQGAKSRQLRVMGGLPLSALIRDYFGTSDLACYAAINRLAKNAIEDEHAEPSQAVHDACDRFLGKTYVPKFRPVENLYTQGRKIKGKVRQKRLNAGLQLNIFGDNLAS